MSAADGGVGFVHLTLSFTDIQTLLTRAVWKLCGEELAAKARDSGYTNDLCPPRCQCTSPQSCTVCVVTCGEPSSSPNCVCAGRRSRPTTLFLSVLHWRVTLNLLLISFDCLIRRRISPVCVVSVTTRLGTGGGHSQVDIYLRCGCPHLEFTSAFHRASVGVSARARRAVARPGHLPRATPIVRCFFRFFSSFSSLSLSASYCATRDFFSFFFFFSFSLSLNLVLYTPRCQGT